MDIEFWRDYCLSLPMTTEDMAFGEGVVLFRVCDKIFACMVLDGNDLVALKCDPDYAIELRDRYVEIEPAYHWNKKYWNQLPLSGSLSVGRIQSLIRHSYSQVVAKLPRALKVAHPDITAINGEMAV